MSLSLSTTSGAESRREWLSRDDDDYTVMVALVMRTSQSFRLFRGRRPHSPDRQRTHERGRYDSAHRPLSPYPATARPRAPTASGGTPGVCAPQGLIWKVCRNENAEGRGESRARRAVASDDDGDGAVRGREGHGEGGYISGMKDDGGLTTRVLSCSSPAHLFYYYYFSQVLIPRDAAHRVVHSPCTCPALLRRPWWVKCIRAAFVSDID